VNSKRWIIGGLVALVLGGWLGFLWVRSEFMDLVGDTRPVYEEGAALGATITANACLDTAFARHPRYVNAGFGDALNEIAFLEGCLRASTPTAMCDSVPEQHGVRDALRFEEWARERCRDRGMTDRHCSRLFGPVGRYCGARSTDHSTSTGDVK
jgi:hypothetical protein